MDWKLYGRFSLGTAWWIGVLGLASATPVVVDQAPYQSAELSVLAPSSVIPSLKRLDEILSLPPSTHRRAVWPVAGQSRISSYFGVRRHPIEGVKRSHQGLDIAAAVGTPIVAIGPGVVVYAGWRRGYGRTVDIEHADGWTTRYAHARRITVQKGQRVLPGQMVGHVGRSGYATGAHLHFELWHHGEVFDPLTLWKSPTPRPLR